VEAVKGCENGRLVSTNNEGKLAQPNDELLNDKGVYMRIRKAVVHTTQSNFAVQGELDRDPAVNRSLGLNI
jgi:hypothetical protein